MASQASFGSQEEEAAQTLASIREDTRLVDGTSCNIEDLDVLQSMAEVLDDTQGGKRKKSRKGGRRGPRGRKHTRRHKGGANIKDRLRDLIRNLCGAPREVYDKLKEKVDSEIGGNVKAITDVDKGKIASQILTAVKATLGTAGAVLVGKDLSRGTSGILGASVVGIVRAAIAGIKLLPDPNIIPVVAGAFNTVSTVGGELASAIAADPQKYVALITAFLITKKIGDLKGALDNGTLYKTVVNDLMYILVNDGKFYETYIENKAEKEFEAYMEKAREAIRTQRNTPKFRRGLTPRTLPLSAAYPLPTESPMSSQESSPESSQESSQESVYSEVDSIPPLKKPKTAKGKGRRRTPKRINRR